MVWGCMSGAGLSNLYFVEKTVNSEVHQSILENTMIPFVEEKHADGTWFKEGYAKVTEHFLKFAF